MSSSSKLIKFRRAQPAKSWKRDEDPYVPPPVTYLLPSEHAVLARPYPEAVLPYEDGPSRWSATPRPRPYASNYFNYNPSAAPIRRAVPATQYAPTFSGGAVLPVSLDYVPVVAAKKPKRSSGCSYCFKDGHYANTCPEYMAYLASRGERYENVPRLKLRCKSKK